MKKEMIAVVDKNGIPTGEILEKEIVHDKNLLHNEVGLFIINSKDQVLIQKRVPTKRFNPNKWGLCAGHVSYDEDNITAMQRELEEEIGVKANKEDIILFDVVLKERKENSHITYGYYMYLDKEEKDFVIQEEELSEVKWIDFNVYKNMVINNDSNITLSNDKYNLDMLDKLEKIILSR